MKAAILAVLMGCLAAGANIGYYLARILGYTNRSGALAIGTLLGATLGVLLLAKPAMKLVARTLQNPRNLRPKILSMAVVVLLLFLLAAWNLRGLK